MGVMVMHVRPDQLVRAEARQLSGSSAHGLMAKMLLLCARPIASVVATWFDRKLQRIAQDTTRSALVMRGIRNSIMDEPQSTEIDPDDALRTQLDRAEAEVQARVEALKTAASSFGRTRRLSVHRLSQSCMQAADAGQELQQEIRRLGSAICAHDANLFTISQAASVCRTADELDAQLEDLMT